MATVDNNNQNENTSEKNEEFVNNEKASNPTDDAPQTDDANSEEEETIEENNENKSDNKELEELKDKHIRLQAEFDNFRRRTMKEKAELIKSGGEKVLASTLSIIDDLERGLDACKDIDDENPLKQGFVLISSKFHNFLKQNGVSELKAEGADFDTDSHEALTEIPAPDESLKGKVVDVIQKGYTLNDKILRFAKVVVGK